MSTSVPSTSSSSSPPPSKMVNENPTSPNAIPPRKSSMASLTSNGPVPAQAGAQQPPRPVLQPIPETSWMASNKRQKVGGGESTLTLVSPSEIGRNLISERQPLWNEEKEKVLMGPYDYLEGTPGKDIRSQMIAAFNAWLQVPPESLKIVTKVIGMLHTASLLVDDVEDNAQLRRGAPVAHSIFGTAQTINSANYVYFVALQELSKLNNPKAIAIYTEELINLHRGQGMDLYWRDSLICPTEAEYLEMVDNKTGGLFRLAIKLMQVESPNQIDCLPLVNCIGLLFQILDDHLNLSTYSLTKGFCEDLSEGKFSFPVIHAIRSDPSNLVLINILRQKPTDEEIKKFAVKYMEGRGSFAYSERCITELKKKALAFVEGYETSFGEGATEGGEGIRKILEKLKV